MIFFILLTCLVMGLSFMSFITYIYNYMLVLIHISETRFNYLDYEDFYLVNELFSNNNIVYLNNDELKSYFCNVAYNSIEDSNLHLYCYDYNININKISSKKKMFYNINSEDVDLLSNYKSSLNVNLLKNKLPNDVLIEISKFIFNININKNTLIKL